MSDKVTCDEMVYGDDEYADAILGDMGLAMRAAQLADLKHETGPGSTVVAEFPRQLSTDSETEYQSPDDTTEKSVNRPKLFDVFLKAVIAG
jgi:hypothetical protein